MEIEKSQINMIIDELKKFDIIMKELKRFDAIEKELKRFDTIEKELKRFDTIEKDIRDIKEEQKQMKEEQKQMKEMQQKMTIQMMESFGKLNERLEDNIAIVQRQLDENNLKGERRYQEQHKLSEILKSDVVRLDNLSIQNMYQHEIYDEILHIERKPQCV